MYFLDNCGGLGTLVNLVKNVLGLVFIILAVVLIVLIIIDLAKAVIASEEKEVKGYQKAVIRRIIYTVLMFFVVTIVTVVFNLLGDSIGDENVPNWLDCWNDPLAEKTNS